MFKASNPTLSEKVFQTAGFSQSMAESMTIRGTINKTIILLLLSIGSAALIWGNVSNPEFPLQSWAIGGAIGGFVAALVVIFKKDWAGYIAPLYALLEGLFLGAISAIFNAMYPGIVIQAVALTLGVMFVMLVAYRSGWIKMTQKVRSGIIGATGAIALVYLLSFVMRLFGVNLSFMYNSSPISIGISIVVIAIAAFNFLLDFETIEKGSQANLPKYMEWYSAFGLMVTLVWLYIEILRLLVKIAGRRD